ncbi:MAG: zinc-ribbon domain-containing protein [Acidobacteria bacterium]|nr:zinc-ribbon domain-containing protein [Acidobacteriota bacterium]
MARYCRQCGASLIDGAKFCRQCGAATNPLESPAPATEPFPASPVHQTESMTAMIQATAPVAELRPEIRPLRKSRLPIYIGGAILLLGVAGAAFFFGARMSGQAPVTVIQVPPSAPPPPVAVEPPKAPPTLSSKPSAPRESASTDSPKTSTRPPETRVDAGQQIEQLRHEGDQLLNTGRYQEALLVYEKIQRLDPENKDVFYLMGQAHQKLGQPLLALQAYRQCTSGPYAALAEQHVRMLEKRLEMRMERRFPPPR